MFIYSIKIYIDIYIYVVYIVSSSLTAASKLPGQPSPLANYSSSMCYHPTSEHQRELPEHYSTSGSKFVIIHMSLTTDDVDSGEFESGEDDVIITV